MPSVTIIRSHQYEGRLRRMKISVDGTERGHVRDGEDLTLDLTPGRHRVTARMDWCRAHLDLDVADSEDELLAETGFRGTGATMIFQPSEAIFLLVSDSD